MRDQCQLEVGWARLAPCASLPPYRWSPRGRMRGVEATCTTPTTHGPPKRMTAPEYCKIGEGRTQRRRLSVRTAYLASQRPVTRGFASRSTGLAGRMQLNASPLKIRTTTRVFRGPGDRQPPIFPPGERRWHSEAHSVAAGRRERTKLMYGHGTVGPSSWHARSTIGRLTPRPWERRMLQSGRIGLSVV